MMCAVGKSSDRSDRNGAITQQPSSANHSGNTSDINPHSSVSYSTGDKATLIESGASLGRGHTGSRRLGGSRIGSRRGIHRFKKPEMRPWSTGLLSCFQDTETCMWGLTCSPCLASRVAERLGENQMVPCLPCGSAALRVKLRTQHNIQGDICADFGVMCCCGCPLAMCQMWRELDHIDNKNSPAKNKSQNNSRGRNMLDTLTF